MASLEYLHEQLAPQQGLWEHWGFVPWQFGPFAGVSRLQRFVKGGILGAIAEYSAWEAIVWQCGTPEEREKLWTSASYIPDVMTQRYLFLLEAPWKGRRIRSFTWGFRGYLEFYAYRPGFSADEKVQDLSGLVDMAMKLDTEKLVKA